MLTNATPSELSVALRKVNERYDGNITFRPDYNGGDQLHYVGRRVRFTLTVQNCRGAGHRRGLKFLGFDEGYAKGKRIKAACWHVHGHFFDELFKIRPDIWIRARGRKITAEDGNWEDSNIGGRMFPLMFSKACDCYGA